MKKKKLLVPFNCFLFDAIYKWILLHHLDPILLIMMPSQTLHNSSGAQDGGQKTHDLCATDKGGDDDNDNEFSNGLERIVYINEDAVRNAHFDVDGFSCLTCRKGQEISMHVSWDEITGIAIGDEASIKELRGTIVLRWVEETHQWRFNIPSLQAPKLTAAKPQSEQSKTSRRSPVLKNSAGQPPKRKITIVEGKQRPHQNTPPDNVNNDNNDDNK